MHNHVSGDEWKLLRFSLKLDGLCRFLWKTWRRRLLWWWWWESQQKILFSQSLIVRVDLFIGCHQTFAFFQSQLSLSLLLIFRIIIVFTFLPTRVLDLCFFLFLIILKFLFFLLPFCFTKLRQMYRFLFYFFCLYV